MSDTSEIQALYEHLLAAWNRGDAEAFAKLFGEDGQLVSADGSEMTGQAEIARILAALFASRKTGRYLGIVRSSRLLEPDTGMLRTVTGLVPAGKTDLDPQFNAVQVIVTTKRDGQWQIALCQNTPAAWHGRPEAVQALTEELRQLL